MGFRHFNSKNKYSSRQMAFEPAASLFIFHFYFAKECSFRRINLDFAAFLTAFGLAVSCHCCSSEQFINHCTSDQNWWIFDLRRF